MSSKETRIRFGNLYALWNFAQSIRVTKMEINTRDRILICHCTEVEISLAIDKYGAEVLQEHLDNTSYGKDY